MSRTVSIVGAGRVGQTLGKRLRQLGWCIGAVVTRSKKSARSAVRSIGAGTPHSKLTPEILGADLILMTTPDGALRDVAKVLPRARSVNYKKKIFLHTSGALDRSVLSPLARRGASTGSMHPMQTFSGLESTRLEGVIFTIEGDRAAFHAATQIARSLGGIPVGIRGKDKPAYHAAGALVAGHGLALVEAATQTLARIGFSRSRALEALLPLIRQMLDNYERLGPHAAWTGPVSRGDFATVTKHGRALRRYPPEFGDTYRALSLLAARVLSRRPAATRKEILKALQRS